MTLFVAVATGFSAWFQWNASETRTKPSLDATIAGWYQLGLKLQAPGEVEGIAAKGVPVLVTVLQNQGRSPLSIVGAETRSFNGPATIVDALLVLRDGRETTTTAPITLSAGETATVAWLLPSNAAFGTDAASLQLLNATNSERLDVLDAKRHCEGILDAVCQHALVHTQMALRDADPMWAMCVPKVRMWNRLNQIEKSFCGFWLNDHGWNAVEDELRSYAAPGDQRVPRSTRGEGSGAGTAQLGAVDESSLPEALAATQRLSLGTGSSTGRRG